MAHCLIVTMKSPRSYNGMRLLMLSRFGGKKKRMSDKFKFDVVIGNPPYQEESKGDSSSSTPIYHHFMEEAYKIAKRVSFITPARFLYNAGATPKAWNKKMLEVQITVRRSRDSVLD